MATASANDDAVVVFVSAPPPPPALAYLFIANMWVTWASIAAAIVAGWALGTDSPVYKALLLTVGVAFLLVPILASYGVNKLALAFRLVKRQKIPYWKVPGAFLREKHNVVLTVEGQALALLGSLQIVGLLMQVAPWEKCHRIGAALFYLATLGAMAIRCFITVPRAVLKMQKNEDWRIVILEMVPGLWKIKKRDDDDSDADV